MVAVSRTKKTERVTLSEREAIQKKPLPIRKKTNANQEQELMQDTAQRMSSESDRSHEAPKVGCALWLTVVLCIGVLGLVIGGVIARTSLVIYPKHYSGAVDISLTLTQGAGSGSLRFYTATKSFSDEQVIPSQSIVARESRATGTVRFYNNTNQAKTFPAKTVVKSSNAVGAMMSYQTKTSITVPAQKNKQPGQKDVGVIAIDVGAQANIGKNDFVLGNPLPGIVIRSLTDITGGAQGTDKVADPASIAAARDALTQSLTISPEMIDQLQEELPQDMVVLPITFAEATPVVAVESNHDDGVHVVARKSIAVVMVKKADLARIIGDRLNVPRGENLTMLNLEGLSIVSGVLASPQNLPDTIPVRITGTAQLQGKVDPSGLPQAVKGLSKAEVRARIEKELEIDHLDIHMTPFWRRILPLDAEKISVTVTNP